MLCLDLIYALVYYKHQVLFQFYLLKISNLIKVMSEQQKLKDPTQNNHKENHAQSKQVEKKESQPDKKDEANSSIDTPILTIIHFNDVYDIQPKGGSMGVVNFKAKLDELKSLYPDALVLFSGDCFSPSTLTNIKEGWQMVYSMNKMGVDVACFGNHEFDFQGKLHTVQLSRACNFPWLLGNISYIVNGDLLGNGLPFITKEVKGLKIGILGIAGEDWIGILSDQYENQLQYEDNAKFAEKATNYLKTVEKCDIIIALTHQRNDADLKFPTKTDCMDIILGGHDHVIMTQTVKGIPVIKSGTNFNNIGLIKIYDKKSSLGFKGLRFNFEWQIFKIVVAQKYDVQLKEYVDKLMNDYLKYDDVVGYTDVELQTRFSIIRRQQSNYGNFMCDLTRLYYDTDAAIINSGSIRNDLLVPVGRLTYSKVSNIINSPLVIKLIPGHKVREMLELSVAACPDGFAGSFLMVSGIRFEYDWKKTPRVGKIWIGKSQLDYHKQYTIAMTSYLARGGDGYELFKHCEMVLDQVKAISTLNLLLKFFKAPDSHQEYQSIKVLQQENTITADDEILPDFPEMHLVLKKKPSVRIGRIKDLRSRFVLNEEGLKLTAISPETDGRIKCTTVIE